MICFEDFRPGDVVRAGTMPVSRDDILAFAERYDPQDFHIDEEAAKASFVGGLIASGWHSCAMLMRLMAETFMLESSSMGSPGIEEVKWLRPVRPGDVLSLQRTVEETKASRSRPEMGLVLLRLELVNQNDEIVVSQRNWIMFGRRDGWRVADHGLDLLTHPPRYTPPAIRRPVELPDSPAEPARWFEDLEIGRVHELGGFVFTAEEIVAFARSFDPQAFHMDAEAARHTAFRGLCASGWHTAAVWMELMVAHRARQEAATSGRVPRLGPSPGFKNLRWLKPVYAGDRISFASEVVETRASASRPGWGLFFHRNTGRNQTGELVYSFEGCAFVERRPG